MEGIQNVKDFGAKGNGTTDDSTAIKDAYNSIPSGGGSILFPPGMYAVTGQSLAIPSYVQVMFEEGAILSPSGGCTVTINGPVTAHPMQHIFGGTGYNSSVEISAGGSPLSVSGNPLGNFSFIVTITGGGLPGLESIQFKYSLDGGPTYVNGELGPTREFFPVVLTFPVPGTGITLTFSELFYSAGDSWRWTSSAAVTLSNMAQTEFSVKWWGAAGDGSAHDDPAIQSAIWAAQAGSASVFLPPGVYITTNSVALPGSVSVRGFSRANGTGNHGTTIQVAHPGIGIVHSNGPCPGLGSGKAVIRDLSLSSTVSPLAAIQFLNVAYSTIQDCDITDCQYGIVLDGAEVCSVQRCNIATINANTKGGVYLTNGPTFTVNQAPGTTNVISIRDCQFNGGEVGLIDDGGGMLEISTCNFNGQSLYSIYMAGRACARVTTSDFESGPVHFDYKTNLPSLQTGQRYGAGQCILISFSECSSLRFDIVSLGGMDLYRNYMVGTPSIAGAGNAASITDFHNTGLSFDSWPTIGQLAASGGPYSARILSGPAAPITGSWWKVGDIVWNTAPTAGGNMGWVCTAAGAPGVWKTFGAIST
jgi:hypothetical protein